VQRRNSFECRRRSAIRSARYYAGGDGAARHPYHPAKHILRFAKAGLLAEQALTTEGFVAFVSFCLKTLHRWNPAFQVGLLLPLALASVRRLLATSCLGS